VQPTFEPFGRMPGVGYDWDGKVSIAPDDSGWTFSAAIQFGKAKRGPKSTHDQANPTGLMAIRGSRLRRPMRSRIRIRARIPAISSWIFRRARILVWDFSAAMEARINFGIRMAQFTEDARGTMTAQVSAPHKYNGGVVREGTCTPRAVSAASGHR
jgi:hypothetical protein